MTIILSTRRLLPVLVLLLHAYTGICSVFFNVKEFGAIGDGKNLDSKAINAAIETAVESGGVTVYLPAGNYLSGSIRLKSNISLYIDQGAIIIAAPVNADNCYDEEEKSTNTIYQDHGHSHWKNSLIWGINLSNVSIVGAGCINGKNLYKFWYSKSQQNANKSISLLGCRNVIIRDLSILHGGWFAILATGVDNLTIDNLKIDTNRDGIDIDCCKNVHISKCNVNSPYDDGICLKSISAELTEMEENNGGEEGYFADFDKINKANVAARLKELKSEKKVIPLAKNPSVDLSETISELDVLNKYITHSDRLAEFYRQIKTKQVELDDKLYAKYPKLSVEEIKTLVVDDKWMQSIETAIKSEVDHISQHLTNRIKELAERYETSLPLMDKEVSELESKVNAHLQKMGFVWQ